MKFLSNLTDVVLKQPRNFYLYIHQHNVKKRIKNIKLCLQCV